MDAVAQARDLLGAIQEFAHAEIEVRTARIRHLRALAADLATHEQERIRVAAAITIADKGQAAWYAVEIKMLDAMIAELREASAAACVLEGQAHDLDGAIAALRGELVGTEERHWSGLARLATSIGGFLQAFELLREHQYVQALGELEKAMFTANRLLTVCLDGVDGLRGGIPMRSAPDRREAIRDWLEDVNIEMAGLIPAIKALQDGHDTDRPSAREAGEG